MSVNYVSFKGLDCLLILTVAQYAASSVNECGVVV